MHKTLGMFALMIIIITAAAAPALAAARYKHIAYTPTFSPVRSPWGTPPIVVTPPTSPKATSTTPTVSTKPTTPPVVVPTQSPKPTVPPVTVPPVTVPSVGEATLSAYVTGYSYWDNTPAGTSEISNPVIHQKAGGTGTFADPITLAVGHSITAGKDILDYPAGTKFYLPYLKKYAIVEDTCGDGNTPQNGPCHTGYKGNVWVDLYVDGANTSQSASDTCMNNLTGVHSIIKNPGSNYPVIVGSLSASGCTLY